VHTKPIKGVGFPVELAVCDVGGGSDRRRRRSLHNRVASPRLCGRCRDLPNQREQRYPLVGRSICVPGGVLLEVSKKRAWPAPQGDGFAQRNLRMDK